MSLDSKLKKTRDRVEEKSITLRIPQNKVVLLEALATHYELTMSSLIRELLDESIIKLQKELLVVSEEAGLKITRGDKNEPYTVRFLPDIVDLVAPELGMHLQKNDFCSDEEFDDARIKEAELSYEYGTSLGTSFIDTKGNEHNIGVCKNDNNN
jgi:hypothetical protein